MKNSATRRMNRRSKALERFHLMSYMEWVESRGIMLFEGDNSMELYRAYVSRKNEEFLSLKK